MCFFFLYICVRYKFLQFLLIFSDVFQVHGGKGTNKHRQIHLGGSALQVGISLTSFYGCGNWVVLAVWVTGQNSCEYIFSYGLKQVGQARLRTAYRKNCGKNFSAPQLKNQIALTSVPTTSASYNTHTYYFIVNCFDCCL